MAEDEIIITNKFILGEGKEGLFSDLKILVKKGKNSILKRGSEIKNKDESVLKKIEFELQNNWIEFYEKEGFSLEITILDIGVDKEGRKYAIKNSVSGAMQMALPKIGIVPPQIFGL